MGEKVSCSQCGESASVFVTLVVKGKVTSRAYCHAHAQELGLLGPTGYALLEDKEPDFREDLSMESPRCPVCGFSQREFERRGRLGCGNCYHTFGNLIEPMLSRMHRGVRHQGKVPRKAWNPAILQDRLRRLDRELDEAVQGERYEEAAEIRDRMCELRTFSQKQLAHRPDVTDS